MNIRYSVFRMAVFAFFVVQPFYSVIGQEQLRHPVKMHKTPEGKLFVNKKQPMYLWLSTSPDESSTKIRLESENHKKFTNPFYFDTEGYNTIRTPSQVDTATKQVIYPIQDIIFEIYTDSRPPVSKMAYENAKIFRRDKKIFVGGTVTLKISATDQMSGVEKTLVSINRETFREYTGEIVLKEEKEYFIQFYSVDYVGNVENVKHETIVVDLSKPKTSISIKKDLHENIVSGNTQIEIEVIESGSGIDKVLYKLDNQAERAYLAPILTSRLSEGEHTLEFWAVDKVGNQEDPNSFSFYVDKTPPLIVEEIIGNKFIANNIEYSSGRSKYKIMAMDNKAGIKEIFYSINNGPNVLYSEPFYLEGSKGNISIRTFAVDNVNNRSTSGQTNQTMSKMYVDLSGPVLTHRFIGAVIVDRDTILIKNDTKINLTGADKESGMDFIEYRINSGEIIRFNAPFVIEKEGFHTIHYTGYDKVGNSNNSEFYLIVDKNAPEIFVNFSVVSIGSKTILDKKMDVYPNHVTLFLSATDDKAGLKEITFKINGSAAKRYAEPLSNFGPGRDYKIEVFASDKLGNQSSKIIEFSVN
jgi:hypothetical protein